MTKSDPWNHETNGTRACLDIDYPPTPDRLRRFRQARSGELGERVKHWGEQEPVPQTGPFGRKTVKEESAASAFATLPANLVEQVEKTRAERVYLSEKLEPLGRGMVRGHNVPQGPAAVFGKSNETRAWDVNVKEVLYPADDPANEESAKRTLIHPTTEPGEQRKHGYNWESPGIDPKIHRFGYCPEQADLAGGGVKNAMYELDLKKTVLIPKNLAQYQESTADKLGQTNNSLHKERGLPEDHVFGAAAKVDEGEANVSTCIEGQFMVPTDDDAGLGRATRPGWRNELKPGDDARAFGVPTVRLDIQAPDQRSVADTQNYGDEPSAQSLLYPSLLMKAGITTADLVILRPRDAIQRICQDAFNVTDEEFDLIFKEASDSANLASVESFAKCFQVLRPNGLPGGVRAPAAAQPKVSLQRIL
eukprot:Rmarinus@m.8557